MSNGGSLRSDNIAYAQMWNGECGMWNEGDFAPQNPIHSTLKSSSSIEELLCFISLLVLSIS